MLKEWNKEGTNYDKHQAVLDPREIVSSNIGKESDEYIRTFLT